MTNEKKQELDALCLKFRRTLIEILHERQTGHPGGSLSVCEILTNLYFNDANISPENINDRSRDKIVLCKGHAAPMLYLELAEKGFFPMEEMHSLRQINSRLQGHPCSKETPGVEASTGPLGAGYPFALGMALSDMHDGVDAYTYAILLDMAKDISGYDCVVLAQASMAHLDQKIEAICKIPVLSSPGLCMEQVKETLKTI